jgi:4-amino-4-deoxy-L-arabinose transferase-like glycosyltransferase
MVEIRRFGPLDLVLLLLVLAVAAGARVGYLVSCADSGRSAGGLLVQDPRRPLPDFAPDEEMRGTQKPSDLDALVHNLKKHRWFGSLAPFAATEEQTAHTSPGYPWCLGLLARVMDDHVLDWTMRWVQCGLGTLTAGLYFLFARRAFRSLLVGALAGFLAALWPFWVINTAAVDDGVVATFLLALVLFLGGRSSQTGGAFGSLLFGLTLAGLALVRAALLPFAFLALLWFLLRTRNLPRGWLPALLAFLGFANGLAPWTVRNFQVFGEPIPVVDSTFLHLWIGNNPHATGGPISEKARLADPDLDKELREITHQPARYRALGSRVWQEIREHPAETFYRRLRAGLSFFLGEHWFHKGELASLTGEAMPDWLRHSYPSILQGSLLVVLLLALLGWRWTFGWRFESMPAALAVVWIVLPYLIGHAELLSGPRLPLDGVLLCYAAFAVAGFLPGARDRFDAKGAGEVTQELPQDR